MTTQQISRPRGRPSKGIGEKFRQVCVYLPPEMIDTLDWLRDWQEQQTGFHINRTDVIRQALKKYIDDMSSSAGRKRQRK